MNDDFDNDADERWCAAQREHVVTYLGEEGFRSPNVGEWPAWHIAPVAAVWAVESVQRPGWVGWWVVSGDCPTDYISCSEERHPRQALRDIGHRWQKAALEWADGKNEEGFRLRNPDQERELAPLLAARARLFLDFASDDQAWT